MFTIKCKDVLLLYEQFPEDGQVGPKHAAIDCDFNAILN
jgi:hypothetical protein